VSLLVTRAVDVASSGHFFTRWSWLVTLPVALTLLGGYDSARTPTERLIGVGIALLVHILLGMVGVGAGIGERSLRSRRARVALVVITIAVLAAVRPLLMTEFARLSGLTLFTVPVFPRIVTNVIVDTVVLVTIATIVFTVRTRRDTSRRLRRATEVLDARRAADVLDERVLVEQVLERTRLSILSSLPVPGALPFDAAEAAASLRRLSDEVVRPLSHELFDEPDATRPDAAPLLVIGRAAAGDPVAGALETPDSSEQTPVRPLAWAWPVVYQLLWTPYVLSIVPRGTAVLLGLVCLCCSLAANLVVARILAIRRPSSPLRFLAFGYLCVGAVLALSVALVSKGLRLELGPYWIHLLVYPIFATVIVSAQAGLDRLARVESDLARTLGESTTLAVRAHNRLVHARRRVARLLHADVQGECAAAALTLVENPHSEEQWRRAVDRIGQLLLDGPEPSSGASANETVGRLLQAWGHAATVEFHADDRVWHILDADPARLEVAVDAISEGLGNALRHSDSRLVRVGLEITPDARPSVLVDVWSRGSIRRDPPSDGYGLAQLRLHALGVSLLQFGDEVRLRVELP